MEDGLSKLRYNLSQLKKGKNYERTEEKEFPFVYDMKLPFPNFLYDLTKSVLNLNEIEKIIYILNWTHSNVHHNGFIDQTLHLDNLPSTLSGNCFNISLFANEVYAFYGFISKSIQTRPYNISNIGTHWVNLVFSRTYNKWIMVDPSFGCYCTDINNKYLSIEEIRSIVIENKKLNIHSSGPLTSHQYYYLICDSFYQFDSFLFNVTDPLHYRKQRVLNLIPITYHSDAFLNAAKSDEKLANFYNMLIPTSNDTAFWCLPRAKQ